MRCVICKNEIENNNHLRSCCIRHGKLLNDNIRFEQINFNIEINKDDFNYNFFIKKYINEEYSILDLSKYFNTSYNNIVFMLKWYDIKKRNLKEATSTNRNNKKHKETFMKLYGTDNPSKNPIIKEKKKKTFLKNYGVDNIFKDEKFKENLESIMLEKYGKRSLPNRYGKMQDWWDSKTVEFKKTHIKKAHDEYIKWWNNLSEEDRNIKIIEKIEILEKNRVCGFSSKLEDRISKILCENNIEHIRQKWLNRKSYDIQISNTNLLIEIQGDFWHANPEIYKPDDIISIDGGIPAYQIWEKDKDKKINAEKYNYTILYLWETDINTLTDNELLHIILDSINIF